MNRNALACLCGQVLGSLSVTQAVVQAGAFHARRDSPQRVMV